MAEKMNPEIKALWLKELRDPTSKQGRGRLKAEEGFCCLGLLTDIWRRSKDNTDNSDWNRTTDNPLQRTSGGLHPRVQRWSGLTSFNPSIKYKDYKNQSLALVNDGGLTFSQIADLIEAQL